MGFGKFNLASSMLLAIAYVVESAKIAHFKGGKEGRLLVKEGFKEIV